MMDMGVAMDHLEHSMDRNYSERHAAAFVRVPYGPVMDKLGAVKFKARFEWVSTS